MSYNYPNQGPPAYDNVHNNQEPLFNPPPQEYSSYPAVNNQHGGTFGAPPMGEPAEPSAHPDNRTAAAQTTGASETFSTPSDPRSGGLGRLASGSLEKPSLGGGGGLHRQSSDVYGGTGTDKGFFGGSSATGVNHFKQTPTQPGVSGAMPMGQQSGSPYVQTDQVPASGSKSGGGSMNMIVDNLNKWATKAEGVAGNVWGHLKVGPSVTDTAWGRMSHGTRLLTEGGFEGVYKSTFGMATGEQLRKTYACYLSTSTGPVAGTLYISNLKYSFCSDRPLSYAPTPGQQAWSYYKVVIPLEKVREVIPSVNENKPLEKYIQVVTKDGHDFWFMGFVNYDKGVKNLQAALNYIGVIDPNAGLKSPFAGLRSSSHTPNPVMNPTSTNHVPFENHPPSYQATQGTSTANPYTK